MAFNVGLSGLRAASTDLDVTGNNIANASTVGFKGSKAQFGDLYANGFLSSGSSSVGDGVRVQDIQQSFGQGNISFTDNGLDMAINGDGFFVLNNGGEVSYSRAGQFGVDNEGFVVNNQGARVQGFQADEEGNVSGVRDDLYINRDNLSPRRTTGVNSELNLDAREGVLAQDITRFTNTVQGNVINNQNFEITYSDNTKRSFSVPSDNEKDSSGLSGLSALSVANRLSQEEGVSASATTDFTLNGENIKAGDSLNVRLPGMGKPYQIEIPAKDENDVALDTPQKRLAYIQSQINESSFGNKLNATITDYDVNGDGTVDEGEGNGNYLRLIENSGQNVEVSYAGSGSMNFASDNTNVPDDTSPSIRVGEPTITLDRGVSIKASTDDGSEPINLGTSEAFSINKFDPSDQRTYNHATSSTIYDSLGNPHVMTQYFVKEPPTGVNQGSRWSLYVQIDGENIGDPPGPNGEPSEARYDLLFNDNGQLESVNGEPQGEVLISNWSPLDPSGQPNGADGPRQIANGGQTPIPDPPISSNFTIDLNETTQFGSEFAVNDQKQDGYTTGRLSGLDISNEGVVFARYTNGQSQTLGQVALANFNNREGLAPRGDTGWVETFESGQPVIGKPDTGSLGSITASSVEESNVDLSAELVNLIIAQRNYQANAKTIETADSVTQTIINLR